MIIPFINGKIEFKLNDDLINFLEYYIRIIFYSKKLVKN